MPGMGRTWMVCMAERISRRQFLTNTTVAVAAAYAWEPLLAYGKEPGLQPLRSSLMPARSGALVDVARNRLAYQSGAADFNHTGHLVTDGSGSTYWESLPGGEQWVAIDLGEAIPVSRMTLHWGSASPQSYRVEVSTDGTNPRHWSTVHSATQVSQPMEQIALKITSARHVRLIGVTSGSDRGFSVAEIEVWAASPVHAAPVSEQVMTRTGTLLNGGWNLQSAAFTSSSPEDISSAHFVSTDWLPAVVPGTVLASYLKHGAVPDPNFGNQQSQVSEEFFTRNDFWYRNSFTISPACEGQRLWLVFEGINWKADVYVNGKKLGDISGAFLRRRFDITEVAVRGGSNCVAVLVHQVAHPGEIQDKHLGGSYKNGGVLALDSPTFTASIGWNWVPTIRGRNTGIWNDVRFETSGDVILDDPWVSSKVSAADKPRADLTVKTEITNASAEAKHCSLLISMANLAFRRSISLQPHETQSVTIDKTECSELSLQNPALWWPNGYGDPVLHTMHLRVESDGVVSYQKDVTFGIREMSYTEDNGILTIFVNGQKILCRGGNWGMDDSMLICDEAGYDLRVRMHKDMNLVMIRNWIGMVGKEAFYDCCDRHGLLIWDDFWLANPSDGPDPIDHAMFMANARDKIRRVRHHPSLAIYCGRNEGVSPPDLDLGMREAVASLDGSRYYISASASGLVTGHGPYDNQDPAWYFEHRGGTFHTEQGIVCVPPVESMRAMMPAKDLWPISDMWAIHEYQNPRSVLYTERIAQRYGSPDSIEDYCRKAQMVNMESAKAMMECLQSRQGSAQLIWMTQSAWPALICQLYDYYFEQTAAYFGAKIACEQLHILWDQYRNRVIVANNNKQNEETLHAAAWVFDLQGRQQWHREIDLSVPTTSAHDCFSVELPQPAANVFFLKLKLSRSQATLSENFYWSAGSDGSCKSLNALPRLSLPVSARMSTDHDGHVVSATVSNPTSSVAVAIRLKLLHASSGKRVLPAMYEDNYFSLLPGEKRSVAIRFASSASAGNATRLALEGWNIADTQIRVEMA